MRWLLLLAQVTLSLMFLAASLGKMLQLQQFRDVLRRSRIPEGAVQRASVAVPLAELAPVFRAPSGTGGDLV